MEKILSQCAKVIKALVKNRFDWEASDNAEDHLEHLEVGGFEITVGDDEERCTWNILLENVVPIDDGSEVSLEEVMTKTLGKPTRVYEDGDRRVLNWEPSKKIMILLVNSPDRVAIDFTQYYTKQ